MSAQNSKYIPTISITGDLFILNICFVFAFCFLSGFSKDCYRPENIALYLYLNVSWLILGHLFKNYREVRNLSKKNLFISNVSAIVFFFFAFLMFFQLITVTTYFQRDHIKYVFTFFTISILLWRFLLLYTFYLYRKLGYNYRNVIVLGFNTNVKSLINYFTNASLSGYRFMGVFSHDKLWDEKHMGDYDEAVSFIEKNNIDEVYIAMNEIPKENHDIILRIINTQAVKIRFVPELTGFSYLNIRLLNYDTVPILQVNQGPLSHWSNRIVKRFFDLVISVLVILFVLSWLIPILYIINKLTSKGPLFFIQKRSGLNDKTFNCIKFKTLDGSVQDEASQVIEKDKRLTKTGGFLRKSNIDELPQFINVLLNQMSAVGPRPHMLVHTSEFKMVTDKFMVRHLVKPGITGLAQVKGYRGEIKSKSELEKRVQLDLSYIENWTLLLDIKIVFLTIWNMIKGDKKAY